ncbi:penicillin-binding protein 2 [Zooshikella harenae]|uniref:Peptidoglycan D,D-transpeptidase MrdA n=1 Tax=Zooshikella harenae TaxID=2827238 RepID=A0ABS5ZHL8_9GAMM|nr:penicillin-binding protein 2 [Zooshikella harenae]MBU2713283.1 penicillin-binding protein 2 [Zooshikella harenae]
MTDSVTFKDHSKENRIFNSRILKAVIILVILTGILISRIFYLQVVEHEKYSTQSDENRIHLQYIPPIRGLIYDTNGLLLADNKPSFNLTLTLERIPDLEKALKDIQQIVPIQPEEIAQFKKRLRNKPRKPFESVPLKFRLTEEEIARISVNEHLMPGVEVEADLIRFYPQGEIYTHTIGYVRRINDQEQKSLDDKKYKGVTTIGKIGIERFYEEHLLGQVGYREVEVNARGRVLRVLDQKEPIPGTDLTLYLDTELQKNAIEALGGQRGAVVALDPKTGGILAMVSEPSYDPNPFVRGIGFKAYAALLNDPARPLYNRASSGEYPPASTIKPFVAIAGLNTETVTPANRVFDPGWYRLPNQKRLYRNWKRGGHGWVNLERAIVVSNDTYFYDLALKLGIDNLHDYLQRFGLGIRTALDVGEQRPGLMPSREWKMGVRNLPWFPGETVITGIGQGFMKATPLQLATATAVLANKGKWVYPQLLKSSTNPIELVPDQPMKDIVVNSPEYWKLVYEAMRKVVHDRSGTAHYRIGRDIPYTMAGKTGTAQVVGIKQNERYDASKLSKIHHDHGLFIGFAPIDDPQIAIAVVVENGGGGSSAAAPVARKILDAYLIPRLEKQAIEQAKKLERNSNTPSSGEG